MELFAIVGAVPAGFVASALYAGLLRKLAVPQGMKQVIVAASAGVLAAVAIEWTLLASLGTLHLRAVLGPAFEIVHLALFVLALPALVHVLVFAYPEGVLGWWFAVGVLGALLALPVALTQYVVSEKLYGVDGAGGPCGRRCDRDTATGGRMPRTTT